MTIKVGDWVIYSMRIGQITDLRDGNIAEFSDGHCRTSGIRLIDECRPLTLRSKVIASGMERYYRDLRTIDGETGFNYPDISSYFSRLAIQAIDNDGGEREVWTRAQAFVQAAREYHPVIDGVRLFRRNLSTV